MLNPLQKFCFEQIKKQKMGNFDGSFQKKYGSHFESLLLGKTDNFYLINDLKHEIELGKNKTQKSKEDLQYYAELNDFIKKLKLQRKDLDKFDHIIGFRRTCLDLYFDLLQNSHVIPKELDTALQDFIFSGKESDLNSLIIKINNMQMQNLRQLDIALKNSMSSAKQSNVNNLILGFKNTEANITLIYEKFESAIDVQFRNYTTAYNQLSEKLQNPKEVNFFTQEIQEHCKSLLTEANRITKEQSHNKASLILLVDVLSQTNKILETPNDDQVIACRQLSRKLNSHTVHWQRIVGVFLMVVGALAGLAGLLTLPTLAGGVALVKGAAALIGGYGLFHHGAKSGLSLHTNEIAKNLHSEVVKSNYFSMFDTILQQPVNSEEEAQSRDFLVYNMLSMNH